MTGYNLYEQSGAPFTGRRLAAVASFLQQNGLEYDEGIEYTVNLVDSSGRIAATGSLRGNVLQCIATDEALRGEGLTARIVTLLRARAFSAGRAHLFLFTKPKNRAQFEGLGFYPITQTERVLLCENENGGIRRYLSTLSRPKAPGVAGAIVANCNPFTLGHRRLIEQASEQCDTLHLFILSEDRSEFSAAERFGLVRRGISDLKNVLLHPTSDYLISSATFPTYFQRDKVDAASANCELDIRIFGEFFVPELRITRRFVGAEPFDPVTAAYNSAMERLLPAYGVRLVTLPRFEIGGVPVSASRVREALHRGDFAAVRALVPDTTYEFLRKNAAENPAAIR